MITTNCFSTLSPVFSACFSGFVNFCFSFRVGNFDTFLNIFLDYCFFLWLAAAASRLNVTSWFLFSGSWWWRFESVWFHSSTLLSTLFSSQWRIHSCPVVNEFLLAVPLRSYCYAYLRWICPGPIRPHGPRSLLLMRAHLSQHAIALAISFFFCLRIIKNTFCNENILSMNILFFVVVDCVSKEYLQLMMKVRIGLIS